jgi:4-hydroxybenzoyl-CoA thioesterase
MAIAVRTAFRVAWGDCAPSGAVFYPNYFRWFDKGTWDLFEAAGQPIVEMERRYGTVGIPIVDIQASFQRPCRLQDEVVLESRVVEWQAKRFRLQHQLTRAGDAVVTCVETRFWGVRHPQHADRLSSAEIPAEVIAAFEVGDG